MSKILVVLGATGKQGGSVINAVLGDPKARKEFALRAITRDTSKPSAKALAGKGVETVTADLADKASLVKAFEGAYAVFSVTDYWATLDKSIELQQGKNVADAAKVSFNFWNTTNGKLSNIEHFDSKAAVEEYIRSIDLPTSFYLPGFYMSNIPESALRKDKSTGKFVFALPLRADAQIPAVDVEADTGKFVKAILLNRDATLGRYIYGSPEYLSPQDIVDGFVKAYPKDGEGTTFQILPDDVFKGALASVGMPEKVQVELCENMHLMNKEFGYYAGEDLKESLSIVTDPLVTWSEYVKTVPAFKDLQ
ncbi:hypothetical protein IAR55_002605 [Kwoniella newhampshirensis]|uniref:NmrA-like domain-containing protein n=1 Tax=Kwoniella newhampshirensis TaxID=1651941 RepID=A0AAW0YRH9_9TREE